jgi:hypothetical protein
VRLLVIRGWLDWQELAEARESLTKRFSEKHKSGPSAVAAVAATPKHCGTVPRSTASDQGRRRSVPEHSLAAIVREVCRVSTAGTCE